MTQFLIIIAIFLGETVAIYAEIFSSKASSLGSGFSWLIFGRGLALMIFGCLLLLLGYIFGFKTFKNIWIVSVISITSILIAEPILNYLIFQQLPTKGALMGLILGIIGLILSLTF